MKYFVAALALVVSFGAEAAVSVEFAYRRDANPDDHRAVIVQGERGKTDLYAQCGPGGWDCECLFYKYREREPSAAPVNAVATKDWNSLSCPIGSEVRNPDDITEVRVRKRSREFVTGKVQILTSLSLGQVLGPLLEKKVNKVFRYECGKTFLEGEGVGFGCPDGACITCVNNQRLGAIHATYSYYTFQAGEGALPKFTASYYPGICGRPEGEFARASCVGSTPDLRFGMYRESRAPFVARVQLTNAPEGEERISAVGFAALPDAGGECPAGLDPVRIWRASPSSITEGSIDGVNPPSGFINVGLSLDDHVLETTAPSSFSVVRQANLVKCDIADGDCSNAQLGGLETVQSVPYVATSPKACVIPKHLITDLRAR